MRLRPSTDKLPPDGLHGRSLLGREHTGDDREIHLTARRPDISIVPAPPTLLVAVISRTAAIVAALSFLAVSEGRSPERSNLVAENKDRFAPRSIEESVLPMKRADPDILHDA